MADGSTFKRPRPQVTDAALGALVYGGPRLRTGDVMRAMRDSDFAAAVNNLLFATGPNRKTAQDRLAKALSLKGPAPRGAFRTLHQALRDGETP